VHLKQAMTSPTGATAPAPTPQSMQSMKVENGKSRNMSMNKEFKFPLLRCLYPQMHQWSICLLLMFLPWCWIMLKHLQTMRLQVDPPS
jgi:hypothetical protein